MQTKLCLDSSVQFIKGVGPKVSKLLNRLDVYTVEDLLNYFPSRYEDRSRFLPINKLEEGVLSTVKGQVTACNLRRSRRGMAIFHIAVRDNTGDIFAVWFNQPYLKDYIKKGMPIILYGKAEKSSYPFQFNSPEYEIIEDESDPVHMGKIVPIYPLTKGLNQKRIRKILYNLMDFTSVKQEWMIPDIIKKYGLLDIASSLKEIHFPSNERLLVQAKKRLIFDEFFLLQVLLAVKKTKNRRQVSGIKLEVKKNKFFELEKKMGFKLTASQKKNINEIGKDMCGLHPMNRLLQGDVGSGKTAVAMFAVLLSISNGYQTAFMVPTEILAIQHYGRFDKIFSSMGYKVELLISSLDAKKTAKVKNSIENKDSDLIIGTHSLIQESVNFNNLGLVIIDEQHKFGVLQRSKLCQKGDKPHVLVMTATPIPRTLTMTLYADMDVSIIDCLPKGRKTPKTFWIAKNKVKDVYSFIRKKITEGRQCYVVCPLIEESEKLDLESVNKKFEELKHEFKDYQIGLLHGRVDSDSRNKILEDFKNNIIKILVTTSVIEVGIDFPNASVLIVENSERFGLSALHQLRGRISRSGYQPYCILVSDTNNPQAGERLKSFTDITDGFKIAEVDLKLRGPGEFTGIKQHGLTEFRIADLIRDRKILITARKEAFALVEKSDILSGKRYEGIKHEINLRYKKKNMILLGA